MSGGNGTRHARPGVVAVARAAGVSPSTVSNVYNRPHVVSQELRDRVLRAASDLCYAGADPAARNLRSGRTGAIGVVLRERLAYSFDDPAAVRFLQGVSDAADPQQLALVIVPAYPEQGTSHGPAIHRAAVDGLILYSLVGEDPLVEAARRRRLPTVVVDSPAPGDSAAAEDFDFVGIDERSAAEAAVRHLLDLGHRRLAVLSLRLSAGGLRGPADLQLQRDATASVAKGRLEGAARAAIAAGVDWFAVPVEQCEISDVEHGRASAHAVLDRAPHTTAIFAFSDPLAIGARLAARERGLAVPDDISIVGFDDSAPESEGLTTVHQPLRDKGRVAAQRLLRTLADDAPDGARALLPTRLVVRSSTSAP
jgi:DNA-binding LacI/PurR family transcriptional regulator